MKVHIHLEIDTKVFFLAKTIYKNWDIMAQ